MARRASPNAKFFRTEQEALDLKVTVELSPYDKLFGHKEPHHDPKTYVWPGETWPRGQRLDADDPTYSFERYLRGMITANRDLRDTTRALYLRVLRVHVEAPTLGRADVRHFTPEMLTSFWGSLTAGRGALCSVQQLLSMGFKRAVQTGLVPGEPAGPGPRREEAEPLGASRRGATHGCPGRGHGRRGGDAARPDGDPRDGVRRPSRRGCRRAARPGRGLRPLRGARAAAGRPRPRRDDHV